MTTFEVSMLRIRRADDRGHFNHGWLDTYHTFSFGDYYDPEQMGFRVLRVINEDRVAPGQGFGMHGHRDMEIVTLVLEGQLEHRDSLGSGEVLRPGELQRMTAGTGIRHSEFNPSADEPVHLYQIWLLPERAGLPPSYEQRAFAVSEKKNRLQLVASRDGRDGSLTMYQDAAIYLATLEPGSEIRHEIPAGRHAWLQVLRGDLEANGTPLGTSDAAAVSDEAELLIRSVHGAEIMLFDLP
jgi:redox-sensitive bicupin YhaK (pirin superfamily)